MPADPPCVIRIVIVDDHAVIRDGLTAMLEPQPDLEVVASATDGHTALATVRETQPDVVLMDLRMPGSDGVAAIAEITDRHPEVRVLVLTMYGSDADIGRATGAGATGYLLKDTPRETLFAAIRAAARGETVLAPPVAARLMRGLREAGPAPLSAREIEVLRRVASGAGNAAIARELCISEATVKTHLARIFAKLDVDDRTAAVTVALGRGIISLD